MIYPQNFEQKTGFDRLRQKLRNYCLSGIGAQMVDEISFSTQFELVELQLKLAGEMKKVHENEESFQANNFFDLTHILNRLRIEGTFAEPEDLFNLKRSLDSIKVLFNFFKERQEKYPEIWNLTRDTKIYPYVTERIDQILNNQGKIRDNASVQLHQLRKEIQSKEGEIGRIVQQVMRKAVAEGWTDADANVAIRDGRLVIPVNAAYKRRIKGYVHDESATGKTSYIEPAEAVELNNDLRELDAAERREIVKVLTLFANDIRPYIDDLLLSYQYMGNIDLLRAKALLAIELNAVSPPINNKPIAEWYNAIHPLLYLHLKTEHKQVVPLNIHLNHKQRILVISGPNAGGKSVCLQTMGLLQYMLQCGLLIPVKETSETGIFENVFIDIGDEQSIDNDLSTYSSHLTNMKYFLRNANENTLFLIDEFGAGTEPMLGGAIAEAILEELNTRKTFGVVTTHYTNLKHFASGAEGIINGAMLYDTQHLQPLFKLEAGEPGSSFAFEIARKIGLSESILQLATNKIGEEHIDFDRHLKDIIRDKNYWKNKREQVKENNKRLDTMIDKYAVDIDDIKKKRKEILDKAKHEAQDILNRANKTIENTIREIKEAQAEKERTREVRKNVEVVKEEIQKLDPEMDAFIERKIEQIKRRQEQKLKNEKEKLQANTNTNQAPLTKVAEKPKPESEFIVGDKVRIVGQNTVGEVLDINGKSILVAFGQMSTTLPDKRLEKVSNNEAKKIQKFEPVVMDARAYSVNEKKLNFSHQIDIRGVRADEALQRIVQFIDEANVVGVSEIRILHGKGTGVLRQIIREYLATDPCVQNFADEHIQLGGSGITVVRLV